MMLCDYHANIFNASEIGRSLNIDHKTSSAYINILQGTFMIRKLQPWFANISKRQIKSYKIYFRDSGIFHALLNLSSLFSISTSSKLGASWEGFALEEIIEFNKAAQNECFFWGVQSGAELDLLILKGGKKLAYEFKYSGKPIITKSMLSSIEELKLDYLTVIIPGDTEYKLDKKIKVCGLTKYIQEKK
jgi:predicted AAA+ superfamily ATPase